MPLLTETDYPSIRRAISASFDETTLPDPVIADDLFVGEAELWVAARTSDAGAHAKKAAIYYAAYLLVPSVKGQLQAAENIRAGSQGSSSTSNWKPLADELLRRAEREIDMISNPADVPELEMAVSCSVPVSFVF